MHPGTGQHIFQPLPEIREGFSFSDAAGEENGFPISDN